MYRPVRQIFNLSRCLQQTQKQSYSVSALAGRTYLAGAEAKTFPKFLPNAHHDFPCVFKARTVRRSDLEQFAKNFRTILDSLLRAHGIVLIRGSEIHSEEDFSTFIHSLDYPIMRNIPGLGEQRTECGRNIYGGRPDPPEVNVEPHQEHSYLADFPHLFIVHCQDPVDVDCGGDYIITNVRDVQNQLDQSVLDKFGRIGVRYHRRLPCADTAHQMSWQGVMMSRDHSVVERRLVQHGFHYHWDDDGTLHYWINRPAFSQHVKTGERLWFNQITTQHWTFHSNHPHYASLQLQPAQFPSNTYYGDGSPIETDVIQHIREVTWRNAHGFQFKRGDVLIMDNMLVQHGRLAWAGQRKISVGHAKYH